MRPRARGPPPLLRLSSPRDRRELYARRKFMADKVRVGVIGTGAISGAYLGMAKNFPVVEMAACADVNLEAAKKKAAEFQIQRVCSVDELLADKSIHVVLNLTIPKAHVPIAMRAIDAGK